MAEKGAKKPNIFVRMGRAIARFFKDTKGEMKKIVWPSKKQVRNNLLIVLVFVLMAAVLIFVLDFAFTWLMRGIYGLASKASGSAASSLVASSAGSAASDSSLVSSVVSSVAKIGGLF